MVLAATVEPPPRRLPREAWWAIAAGAALAAAVAVVVGPRILGSDDSASCGDPAPEPETTPGSCTLGYDPEDPLGDFSFSRDWASGAYDWDPNRLRVPDTGETWHDPVEIPDPGTLMIPQDNPEPTAPRYYSVGNRGPNDIVVSYSVNGYFEYVFEVDPSGHGSLVPCLNENGPCSAIRTGWSDFHPDLSIRSDVFYRSLSYPWGFKVAGNYFVGLPTGYDDGYDGEWQDGGPYSLTTIHTSPGGWGEPTDVEYTLFFDLGGTKIVEMTSTSALPGYRSLDYLVLTPLGRLMMMGSSTSTGGDFNQIVWNDGSVNPNYGGLSEGAVSPGSTVCTWYGAFAIDENHEDSLWYAAGTTGIDTVVYLPTSGNPLVEQVRQLHFDSAPNQGTENPGEGTGGEGDVDPYPYRTAEEFLDAKALWAIQRPDGVWLLAMRPSAVADVYECS